MTTKEKLIECRRAYAERGAKFIEITHLDGRKSAIANPKAIKAAMDALKVELDRQIEELGGDETRSGMNEVVRDWMLREHADERKFMEGFSETSTAAKASSANTASGTSPKSRTSPTTIGISSGFPTATRRNTTSSWPRPRRGVRRPPAREAARGKRVCGNRPRGRRGGDPAPPVSKRAAVCG